MWHLVCFIFSMLVLASNATPAPSMDDPYAADMRQRHQMALDCIDQVKIDKKIVERAIRNPLDLPTDEKYKEFLACGYKKQNFQSEKGEMLYENIYDFLERFYNRNDLKILDKCKSITAENDAELAYDSLKCMMKGLDELDKVLL